ncbi:L-valine transporter subunit YgaH [Mangrovibacter yixingensis]|uniref:L-valine transporter subunit YgaH n=1 Tax=Mangrovibacter yixingensis TaxID=1529639 RepID=UPI001CF9DB31|nr:L-valine transporter subunit YgaH [Mangrovibacter yixingensis]
MSIDVFVLGLFVGCVNYLFRYLPLRLNRGNNPQNRRSAATILLDSIGIASICALLVVSTAPDLIQHHEHALPIAIGFGVLIASFYQLRTIIIPTLLSALSFGLVLKLMSGG